MLATSAVVLVIDRLGAGWLGPYGNTWIDSWHFSRLAAQSLLCETAVADSPDLALACRAWWSGQHAVQNHNDIVATLPSIASAAGAATVLVSDEPQVAMHPLAASFHERRLVGPPDIRASTKEIEHSGLFLLIEAAIATLREFQRPALIWIHSRGLSGPWDAPLALRNQFADDEDPEPPALVEPPERMLTANFDPDELLGLVHAYAGQVALADHCLGVLLDALDEDSLAAETLLVVTSPRGYPLGEHLRIGACDDALYGELLHVPLLLRLPGAAEAPARTQQIVQPHELYAAIVESCGWAPTSGTGQSALLRAMHGEPRPIANVAYALARQQRAIRTPAWFLREASLEGTPHYELFAKPDDRWEVNEISSRCRDVVELLARQLDQFEAAARANRLTKLPPLAEILCDIWG